MPYLPSAPSSPARPLPYMRSRGAVGAVGAVGAHTGAYTVYPLMAHIPHKPQVLATLNWRLLLRRLVATYTFGYSPGVWATRGFTVRPGMVLKLRIVSIYSKIGAAAGGCCASPFKNRGDSVFFAPSPLLFGLIRWSRMPWLPLASPNPRWVNSYRAVAWGFSQRRLRYAGIAASSENEPCPRTARAPRRVYCRATGPS